MDLTCSESSLTDDSHKQANRTDSLHLAVAHSDLPTLTAILGRALYSDSLIGFFDYYKIKSRNPTSKRHDF